VLRLSLSQEQMHLKSPSLVLQLTDAVSRQLGGAVQVRFELGEAHGDTASARSAQVQDARQAEAERGFAEDPAIQRLVRDHGAGIVPGSIRPHDASGDAH